MVRMSKVRSLADVVMCVHVCVHMCVHICVHMFVHVCVHMCVHVYIYSIFASWKYLLLLSQYRFPIFYVLRSH